MKKIFGRIAVFITAVLLAFAVAGCGGGETYPTVNNAGDAVGGSASVMQKKEGFVITVSATVTLPAIGRAEVAGFPLGVDTSAVSADVTVKKTAEGYDFTATGSVSVILGATPFSVTMRAIKKGNILYTRYGDDAWQAAPAADMNVSLNQVAAAIQEAADGWEYGGFAHEDYGYSLSSYTDYNPALLAWQQAVADMQGQRIDELLLALSGDNAYTSQDLADDLAAVLADDNTLADAAAAWDILAARLFAQSEVVPTCKYTADAVCAAVDYTARDLYEQCKANGMAVPAPTAGQTAYDYFMANFGAAIGLREFISLMSDGAVDLAALRQTVLTAVFDEGLTVGELYDMFARSVDAGVRELMRAVGYPERVEGAVLGAQNLAAYTFGDNFSTGKLALNKDLSIRSISFSRNHNVSYNGQKLLRAEIAAQLDFSYTGMKDIVAPRLP